MPMLVFVIFVFGTWYALSLISNRNSQAEDRLERIGRPKSLTDIDLDSRKAGEERFAGLKETISSLGNSLEPQSDLEKNALRIKLANAGFRSEAAPAIFQGIRIACLLGFLVPAVLIFGFRYGMSLEALQYIVIFGGLGFYLPAIVLWYLR